MLKSVESFIKSVSVEDFAKYIDHTLLRVDSDEKLLMRFVEEAKKYGFRCLVVSPYHVAKLAKLGVTKGGDICVASVVGFPNGYSLTEAKVCEARKLFELGAKEVDMVMNIQAFKSGDYSYVEEDIKAVVDVAKAYNGIVKVIIETGLLTDEEKVKAAEIVAKSGAHFVKTSTGFQQGVPGATIHDVSLLKRVLRGRAKIKASGGIRHALDAIALILVGADVIGTSAAVQIIEEFKKLKSLFAIDTIK